MKPLARKTSPATGTCIKCLLTAACPEGRETPENGPRNPTPSDFCLGWGRGGQFEVHGAKKGTTYSEPIQSLTYWTIYSGGTLPIYTHCVEKALTQVAFSPPPLSLTFALLRSSRRAQATHKHYFPPIRSPMYPLGTGCDCWPNDAAQVEKSLTHSLIPLVLRSKGWYCLGAYRAELRVEHI